MNTLTVSLIIIALNEESSLLRLLNDVKKQDYPHDNIEIILVDSMSTDKTSAIMQNFKNNSDFKRVICDINQKIILPSGWNVALKHVSGDIIIRLDAHSRIPVDFITKNILCINQGHDICGGKVKNYIPNQDKWTQIVNIAEDSMFGGSIAAFRHKDTDGYVKTLAFGAYKKSIFDEVGLFNESLVRTEDNEMHYRMRCAGYKFYYNPWITSYRETRPSLYKLMRQKFLNGYWIGRTFWICPKCIEDHHFIPMFFVLGIIFTSLLYYFGFPMLGNVMWSVYWGLTVLIMLYSTNCVNNPYVILLPFIFFFLHLSYGVGTIKGMLKL